jgi:hypothetical protein
MVALNKDEVILLSLEEAAKPREVDPGLWELAKIMDR